MICFIRDALFAKEDLLEWVLLVGKIIRQRFVVNVEQKRLCLIILIIYGSKIGGSGMRINATYTRLVNGGRLIGGYKISLTKTKVERAGFKNGDEVEIEYKKDKIIIRKKGT